MNIPVGKKRRFSPSKTVIHLVMIVASLCCVVPFLLIISISLSSELDVLANGYSFFPREFTTIAYEAVLVDTSLLLRSYGLTLLVTALGAFFGTLLASTLGFVLSRPDYKFRHVLSLFVFFTMLFNGGMVPAYILIVKWLGLKNTLAVLFVPALFSPFYVLLMRGFMSSLPQSLYESAHIDGASEFTVFMRIAIPLSKSAVATIALFYTLQFWNDWFLCNFYTDIPQLQTLQAMLMRIMQSIQFMSSPEAAFLMAGTGLNFPTLTSRMAMCVLAAGPMLLIFPFFQKYFVKGIVVGSVKG